MGGDTVDITERVQINCFKQIFGLKKSTPSYMLYGELGIMPHVIDIHMRITSFWPKLIVNSPTDK